MSQYGEKEALTKMGSWHQPPHSLHVNKISGLTEQTTYMQTTATEFYYDNKSNTREGSRVLVSSISRIDKWSDGLPLSPQELRIQFSIWQNLDSHHRCGRHVLQGQVLSGATPSILQTTGRQDCTLKGLLPHEQKWEINSIPQFIQRGIKAITAIIEALCFSPF